MAWEFLKPILTPNALATIQANPVLLAYLLGWIGALLAIWAVVFAIHFQTSKAYKKPKKPAAKGAAPSKPKGFGGFVGNLKAKLRI